LCGSVPERAYNPTFFGTLPFFFRTPDLSSSLFTGKHRIFVPQIKETTMQGTKNLTEGPIKKQLFNLALPIMGTSFIQMPTASPIWLGLGAWGAKR
jgi:hypothetical protein